MTDYFGVIDGSIECYDGFLFIGTRDECIAFMNDLYQNGKTPEEDFSLAKIKPAGNGFYDIQYWASYVLNG